MASDPNSASGYPSDFTIPEIDGFEWALFPTEMKGSTTTYVPDYWDFYGTNNLLYHGGSYSQSQECGPFYVNFNGGAGTAAYQFNYVGCRIQERPPKIA